MAQVKVYARKELIATQRDGLSAAIQAALQEAIGLPATKRFQRFFPLAAEDFIYPDDRSERYVIIEISMFEGRSEAAKKRLLQEMIARVAEAGAIPVNDIEITIFETPRASWGIRGLPGDELALNYTVEA